MKISIYINGGALQIFAKQWQIFACWQNDAGPNFEIEISFDPIFWQSYSTFFFLLSLIALAWRLGFLNKQVSF
jgi:hypothetical protein